MFVEFINNEEDIFILNLEKIIWLNKSKKTVGLEDGTIYQLGDIGPILEAIEIFRNKARNKIFINKDKPRFNRDKMCYDNLSPELIKKWKEVYPAVNIEQEIKKSESWIVSNPKNFKTNITRFLNNWFAKCQDSPKTNNSLFYETAIKCMDALSRFGHNEPKLAHEYVGDLGARAIKKVFGTWLNFCLKTTEKNEDYYKKLLVDAMKASNVL